MKGVENRKAYFSCILCFWKSPEEIYFFEGRVKGLIAHEARGVDGFGYDPIFIPEEQDFHLAENSGWKQLNSHRARAAEQALNFLS
jgi:XTP/dITP diphosphohydrolase